MFNKNALMKKIFNLRISKIINNKKKQGKKIVLCHGVFIYNSMAKRLL